MDEPAAPPSVALGSAVILVGLSDGRTGTSGAGCASGSGMTLSRIRWNAIYLTRALRGFISEKR
jgi:hypothetical protein